MNWYTTQKIASRSTAIQKLFHFVQSIGGLQAARQLAATPDEQLPDGNERLAENGLNRFFTKIRKKMLLTLLASACGVSALQMAQNTDYYLVKLFENTPTMTDPSAYDDANIEIANDNAAADNTNWEQFDSVPALNR
jgi:hypothetical protein